MSVDQVVETATKWTGVREPERNELTAGEQLIARADAPTVAAADLERVTSWREGRLVFRDDPRLSAVRASGVFNAGRTASFLLALETVHPVMAQQLNENRIALLWRE